MSRLICAFVVAQALTFVGLAAAKFATGDTRQGAAQVCLAIVTLLIYL